MTTNAEQHKAESILDITSYEQYRAVTDLIKEGRADATYYALLVLSSIIIAAGLLLGNSAVLIGGMLVTPVLTPVLIIALGIAVGKIGLVQQTVKLIAKSAGVILGISFIAGVIFNVPENSEFYRSTLFDDSLRAAFLYFLVALASGIAATYAWIRKEVTNILPGISIAVSLVPPLASVAIWIAALEFDLMRFFLMVFLFNLFGIIMGGLLVFSMLGFYRSHKFVEKHIIKEDHEGEVAQEHINEHTSS
jgi:uncharacterized hydrophobic protein (TIGR00271 family)